MLRSSGCREAVKKIDRLLGRGPSDENPFPDSEIGSIRSAREQIVITQLRVTDPTSYARCAAAFYEN